MSLELINPLTAEQIEKLRKKMPEYIDRGARAARILCNGKAVSILDGILVGGNVMYHPVFWDRTDEFFDEVLSYLKENNPGVVFKVVRG